MMQVPFFAMGTLSRDEETEEEIIGKVSSLGFHYLNIAHYLRKNVFRGMTTEHGWESVIVRYTTFLLLTYIANSLLIKTPNRVNQDVLRKAISSGNYEMEMYNNLLMKRASDWMWVKSNQSLTDVMDLTASNAYEITQMLWKIYHRSRSHSSPRRTSRSKNRSHRRKEKKDKGYSRKTSSSPKPGSSKGERGGKGRSGNTATTSVESASCSDSTIEDVDAPREKRKEQEKYNEKQESSHKKHLPAGQVKLSTMKNPSRMNNSPPFDVILGHKTTNCDEQGDHSARKDEESLEEGEIPESPSGSSKEQRLIQADLHDTNEISSDESSSEGEIDIPNISSASSERAVVPGVAPDHQYYQYHPAPYGYYGSYQNYQTQVPIYSVAPQQIQYLDLTSIEPVITIDVSDEEPAQEEKLTDNDADEAIIKLNSEEESRDKKSLHNERIELRQPSPQKEKRMERTSKYGGKDKLRLMSAEGIAISWPSDKARSGQDTLWKWWRNHIQHNNGLMVVCHSGIEKIHGAIPSLSGKKGTCIAVPKIVDDMQQFLACLDETKFPEFYVDLNGNACVYESCENSNEKSVNTAKLLPLAEELSRGSVKRIHFEISKKKIPSVTARITIKEFASIRNLTAITRQKSDLDIPREPKASYSSNFYSYGEQMSSSSMLSTDKAYGPPLGHWITTSKTKTENPKDISSKISTRASESQKTKRSSANSDRRRGTKSSSKETSSKRSLGRTSSSSDRSDYRERSPSKRHGRRRQSLTGHRSRNEKRYNWYRERRLTDGSEDSSPR